MRDSSLSNPERRLGLHAIDDGIHDGQYAQRAHRRCIATVVSLTYIVVAQPESLRESRAGVPFFTPQVMDPDTGEGVSVDRLVQHFKSGQ